MGSLSWGHGAPSPLPRAVTPHPGSTGIVSFGGCCVPVCLAWAGCVSLGAEELLGFGSCQSQVLLTPLYPCWALGTAVCPLHVLLSCPSLWAGAVGWAVFQDRDALLQPHAGPGELSPVHCCPWKQGGAFSASLSGATRRSGAVETPLTAEPICVSSGSLFLTPCFWGCSSLLLPQFSTSSSAPSLPWDTLACPMSHCLQGTVLFLPRLWERQSSVLPSWGGKVCSCFCLFPMFIPRLSSPLAAAMECPWSSHLRCQIWLLPVPQQPLLPLLPTAAPSLEKPGCSTLATVCWCPACGAAWLNPISWDWGRQESCQPMGPPSFPLPFPREAFGVGLWGDCLYQGMSLGKWNHFQPRRRCQSQS